MARQTKSKYVDAAIAVLTDVGGGPISSKMLIDLIVEKKKLPYREYLYHNVLRRIRLDDRFDTTVRGQVRLIEAPEEAEAAEPEQEVPVSILDEVETAVRHFRAADEDPETEGI